MTLERIPATRLLIGGEEIEAVGAVMCSGMLTQGPQVAAFEEEFTAVPVPGTLAVAVNSGTSALHLRLLAAGIDPGDEVIVPSFTFVTTAGSVALSGTTPVFADIDEDSFCLDPACVEAAITQRTTAIMPVHLYGHPAAMEDIGRIAKRHGLMVFEDTTQAYGASLNGKHVGSFDTFGAFSLYPTKNMTSGEGGMVTTTDRELARRVRLLRNQGVEHRYANEPIDFNNRMTDIHAAIGRVQLKKIEAWTQVRRKNAAFFDENPHGVITPPPARGAHHVYHQYTVRIPDLGRERFMHALRKEWDVDSGVYCPIPNHHLPSLEGFIPDLDPPVTHKTAREVVSLPVHPALSEADLERIVHAVNTLAKAGSQ